MTYRKRVDANHGEIVKVLRRLGWRVLDTSRAGDGFPDLVAYHLATGELRLVEVKTPKGKLTAGQQRLLDEGWPIVTCRSVEQAAELLNL